MKRMVKALLRQLPTLVLLAGASAITIGAALIYLPAGFITGGGLAVAGAVLSIWGEDDRK